MSVVFLHKDPKKCAELYNFSDLMQIPFYTRLLCASISIKNPESRFHEDNYTTFAIKEEHAVVKWLLESPRHRHFMFCLIKAMIKEFDKTSNSNSYNKERLVIKQINFWGEFAPINWDSLPGYIVKFINYKAENHEG